MTNLLALDHARTGTGHSWHLTADRHLTLCGRPVTTTRPPRSGTRLCNNCARSRDRQPAPAPEPKRITINPGPRTRWLPRGGGCVV